MIVAHFHIERETKGAVRYQEVDSQDGTTPLRIEDGAQIGTLYIRKSALDGKIPTRIKVTVE